MDVRTQKSLEGLSARFAKHYPKGRNLTLIVLKSHLLVEERMNQLIDASLPKPEFIYKTRFGFLQRLRILQALGGDPEFQALAEAIELLNEIRNSLAHQLESTKPDALIPRFIDAAFNAATRDPKPLGAVLRQPSKVPPKYSRVALGQAVAIVVGLLIRQHANIAA
jgi:hypothetical protein